MLQSNKRATWKFHSADDHLQFDAARLLREMSLGDNLWLKTRLRFVISGSRDYKPQVEIIAGNSHISSRDRIRFQTTGIARASLICHVVTVLADHTERNSKITHFHLVKVMMTSSHRVCKWMEKHVINYQYFKISRHDFENVAHPAYNTPDKPRYFIILMQKTVKIQHCHETLTLCIHLLINSVMGLQYHHEVSECNFI